MEKMTRERAARILMELYDVESGWQDTYRERTGKTDNESCETAEALRMGAEALCVEGDV